MDLAGSYKVLGRYDVIVVGGGTAGSMAAIAAGRMGAKTLLIEQYGFLGGSATAALVLPMMPNHIRGRPLVRGLSEEVQQRLLEEGFGAVDRRGNSGWFNPEGLKIILEEMALEAGVDLLYYTFFDDVLSERGRIKGIVFVNKSGRTAALGRIVVDATGDGDVAFKAGAPFESGRNRDGKSQYMSLRFLVGGVDMEELAEFLSTADPRSMVDPPFIHFAVIPERGGALEELLRKGVEDGTLLEEDINYFQAFSVPGSEGLMAFNCPRIPKDYKGFDARHLTLASVEGKRMILRLFKFLKRRFPGFEKSYIAQIAPMVGVRESRRILGEYILSKEDVLSGRKFPDAVCRCRYPIDIHLGRREPIICRVPEGDYYEIPYRCLVPLKVDNLLVAGRAISATFEAQASLRIQPIARCTGEAAGIAAALCAERGISPRELDGRMISFYRPGISLCR